jgi:ankyrin repeat protein
VIGKLVFSMMLGVCMFQPILLGQATVDFGRDVQPLFQTYCVSCHGPNQQMNGFRLDRRGDAMRGGTIAVIAPGNSAGSRMYQMLVGNQFGARMPLTGPLKTEQIETVRKWIDEGAVWPDALSGETPPPAPDPKADQLMAALRSGETSAFRKLLNADAKAARLKGFGGSTPLMYAVLYSDAANVRLLLDQGADPNVRNNAGATALMWVGSDVEKARLLIDRGADVNARSDDGRTPLLIATTLPESTPLVKLLLEHKANPAVVASSLFGPLTPISAAALTANEGTLRLLLDAGADLKASGFLPQFATMLGPCGKCAELVKAPLDSQALSIMTSLLGPPANDASRLTAYLDRGVDINMKDAEGRTLLMLAASSDAIPVDIVRTLLDRGAKKDEKAVNGYTALDFASLRGQTAVTDLLIKAGAPRNVSFEIKATPKPAASVRAAVERSLPLLQRTDNVFIKKSGCVSCHNNTLAAVTVAAARRNGLTVNEQMAAEQRSMIAMYIENWRERLLQNMGIPGDSDTVSYMLLGMAAENFPANAATDAMARFVKNQQLPNGQWMILAHRPPIESNNIQVTAASMRSLQLYAPKATRAEYDKAIVRAANWLKQAKASSNEERAFQILGLRWAGVAANNELLRKAVREVMAQQKPDGGWAQLPTLGSDAYATGQTLVALREAGVPSSDPAYQKGIQFLLTTQLEDGSWFVKTRAIPLQPYFEAGFPHGTDQWISAAASNWAATALAQSLGNNGRF